MPKIKRTKSERFYGLIGPSGYITCVSADNDKLLDRHKNWYRAITVHLPLTYERAGSTKNWICANYAV